MHENQCQECGHVLDSPAIQFCPTCGARQIAADSRTFDTDERQRDADFVESMRPELEEREGGGLQYDGFGHLEMSDESAARPLGSLFLSPFGRIGQGLYVLGLLLILSVYCTYFIITYSFMPMDDESMTGWVVLGQLFLAFPLLMLSIKRLHDFGSSGWGVCWCFVCGYFTVLLFTLIPGMDGPNEYGVRGRLRWGGLSFLAIVLLLISGAYSLTVIGNALVVEADYQRLYEVYEDGRLAGQAQLAERTYGRAKFLRRLCPFCPQFAGYEMYSAWLYGSSLGDQQKTEEAITWLNRALAAANCIRRSSLVPDVEQSVADMRIALAQFLDDDGRAEEAKQVREQALTEIDGGQVAGLDLAAADLLLEQQKYREAHALYDDLIEGVLSKLARDPGNHALLTTAGDLHHNRALSRLHQGDAAGAEADVREAISFQSEANSHSQRSPYNGVALGSHHQLAGWLHLERGEDTAALTQFEMARRVDPTNVQVRGVAAEIYYNQLEFAKVVEALASAHGKLEPRLEYLLVVCLLHEKQTSEAWRILDRLRSSHDDALESYFLTGVRSMEQGDYAEAVETLSTANAMQPWEPAILFDLALCLFHSGRQDEAAQAVGALQEVNASLAEKVRRHLASSKPADEPLEALFELAN